MTFNKITYSLYQKVKYLIDAAYPNIDENVIGNYKKINIVLSKKTLKQNEKYEDRKCIIYNLYRQEYTRHNACDMHLWPCQLPVSSVLPPPAP